MLIPRTILKSNRKLAQQQAPASQHSILISKLLQAPQRTVISAKGEPTPPLKIRPEMRAHHYCRQHLSTCRAESPLRQAKAAAGIRDHHLLIILNLIQNSPTANRLASVSNRKRPSSVGKPSIGALIKQAFRASNAVCCRSVHTKGGTFPCQCHQRFR